MRNRQLSSTRLVTLCCAVYFTSYLTRKAYEASILAICDETGLVRTAAGLAGTATVALYGSGQFVTGWMADRIDPRRIVLSALLLTAACNAAMPFTVAAGVAPIIAINALNGFAQAMFWPPLVKVFATGLSPERYKGAVFAVNAAANVAIVAVFALVAGCVRFADWRLSFWLAAGVALAMAAAWGGFSRRDAEAQRGGQDLKNEQDSRRLTADSRQPESDKPHPASGLRPPTFQPLNFSTAVWLVPVALAIVCMGALRDGIEAWAPSIVSDLYGLGTSGSTASVALLPLFAVASMAGARSLRRVLGDEIRAALALLAIGLGCAVALLSIGGSTLAGGLPLLALLSAAMHGVNLMLVCELPGRFAGSGRVGTISGALNACVYVGAAISIYGFAALREHFAGWRPVFALWVAFLSLASSLCFAALRRGGREADLTDGPPLLPNEHRH